MLTKIFLTKYYTSADQARCHSNWASKHIMGILNFIGEKGEGHSAVKACAYRSGMGNWANAGP